MNCKRKQNYLLVQFSLNRIEKKLNFVNQAPLLNSKMSNFKKWTKLMKKNFFDMHVFHTFPNSHFYTVSSTFDLILNSLHFFG